MEPLSGVASVIAVIQLSQMIGKALKDYYEGAREAQAEINSLYNSVRTLEAILTIIKDLAEAGTFDASVLQSPTGLLAQCKGDLVGLQGYLPLNSSLSGRRGRLMQSLKWPFQKGDVQKKVEMIEQHKSALSLYIGTQNLSTSFKHHDLLDEIQQEILHSQDGVAKRRIIEWLDAGNPSIEHNIARQRHEPGTGSWLTSGPHFKAWMNTDNSALWVNGNAGCGKTILCSTAIVTLQNHCKTQSNSAIAYWYFTFADKNKLNLSNFLCSIIRQLLTQQTKIPDTVKDTWKGSGQGTLQPSLEDLLSMLRATLDTFDDAFVVFDALDEFPKLDLSRNSRGELLNTLKAIFSWNQDCLHILMTSRREIDIEEALIPRLSGQQRPVSLQVEGNSIDADISAYVRKCLEGPDFKIWDEEFKIEVETSLTNRAHGMFRLVSLQLDDLRRVSKMSKAKVRSFVNSLPDTLGAFYDKLLLDIDPYFQDQALMILRWVAFSPHPLTLAEITEAITIHPDSDALVDLDDRLMGPYCILDILPSGLVFVPQTPPVETSLLSRDLRIDHGEAFLMFSHFSVKEYLLSSAIKKGNAASFFLDGHTSHQQLAAACLAYVLWIGKTCNTDLPANSRLINIVNKPLRLQTNEITLTYELWLEARKSLTNTHVLLDYASRCWPYHLEMCKEDLTNQLSDFLIRLLGGLNHAFHIWRIIVSGTSDQFPSSWQSRVECKATPSTLPSPAVYRPATLYNSGTKQYICFTEDDPFGYAVWLGLTKVALLIFEHGREALNDKERQPFPWPYLARAASKGWIELVEFLLAHGADVNATAREAYYFAVAGTALEAAARSGNTEVARILLKAGVDVNKKGRKSSDKTTCAFDAALSLPHSSRKIEMLQLLVSAGVDVNYTLNANNFSGCGVSLFGVREREVFDLIMHAGANDDTQSHAMNGLSCIIFEAWRHGDGYESDEASLELMKTWIEEFKLGQNRQP